MDVYYKCVCMGEEAMVWVPDRKDDQEVTDWVANTVGMALSTDHRNRSPLCMRTTMEYAKIPMDDGSKGIGYRPTPN
jgi:hypothetical protein